MSSCLFSELLEVRFADIGVAEANHQWGKFTMLGRRFKVISDSFKGVRRNTNKDRMVVVESPTYVLLAVFDGVSSAKDSDQAVEIASSFLAHNHSHYLSLADDGLSAMARDLNRDLVASDLQAPFSTCSLLLIPRNHLSPVQLLNIGDSRIYAISPQFLELLTVDDSDPYYRNVLTKYLGDEHLTPSDFKPIEYVGTATIFLLCSDGFYNFFHNSPLGLVKFHHIFNMKHTYYLRENIRKMVIGRNDDDATYILVKVSDV